MTQHFEVPEGSYDGIQDFFPFEPSSTLLSTVYDWLQAAYDGDWMAAAYDAQQEGATFWTVAVENSDWSFHAVRNDNPARIFVGIEFGLFAPSAPTAMMVLSWMFLEANHKEISEYIQAHLAAHPVAP